MANTPVEILPAQPQPQAMLVPDPNQSMYLQNSNLNNKRPLVPTPQLILPSTTAGNKRPKLQLQPLAMNPVPAVLQSIQPLTQLPSSLEVSGAHHANSNNTTTNTTTPQANTRENGINTSTNHIKALTGANGAAVCLEAIEKALQDQAHKKNTKNSSDASSMADSSLTNNNTSSSGSGSDNPENLSPEEKARQSRDRNRQHARNTRVRKKAYVEELKRTLNHLVEERDVVVQQKQLSEQGLVEQRDVRFRVLEDFLNLRGRNEADPMRWSLILEDDFSLHLPRADIPGVVCSSGGPDRAAAGDNAANNNNNHGGGMCQSYPLGTSKKVLNGVQDVMEDSCRVLNLLQSLGASALSVSYQCDRDSFMMDGSSVVLNWVATSSGAVTKVCIFYGTT